MIATVDVALVTYNHARFIAQAIESVLMQKTDFPFRIIVGDDCSTDNTQAIIQRYVEQNPGRFETVLYQKHLGLAHKDRVGIKVLERCTAKYVALLEGDDYWTSPDKLQRQVQTLEEDEHLAACFHDVIEFNEEEHTSSQIYPHGNTKELVYLEDFLMGFCPPTCSLMIRRELINNLPDWFHELVMGDAVLCVLATAAQNTPMKYIKQSMAAYRRHSGGIWSGSNSLAQTAHRLEFYKKFLEVYGKTHGRVLKPKVITLTMTLATLSEVAGDNVMFDKHANSVRQYGFLSLIKSMRTEKYPTRQIMKSLLMIYMPELYVMVRGRIINKRRKDNLVLGER